MGFNTHHLPHLSGRPVTLNLDRNTRFKMPRFEIWLNSVYFQIQIQQDAAQAYTISKNCIHILFYGFRRAAGAYGYDGEDLCAKKEGRN